MRDRPINEHARKHDDALRTRWAPPPETRTTRGVSRCLILNWRPRMLVSPSTWKKKERKNGRRRMGLRVKFPFPPLHQQQVLKRPKHQALAVRWLGPRWSCTPHYDRSSGTATPWSTRIRCVMRHGGLRRASRSSIRQGAPPQPPTREAATLLCADSWCARAVRSAQLPLGYCAGLEGPAWAGASDQGLAAPRLFAAPLLDGRGRQHGRGAAAWKTGTWLGLQGGCPVPRRLASESWTRLRAAALHRAAAAAWERAVASWAQPGPLPTTLWAAACAGKRLGRHPQGR